MKNKLIILAFIIILYSVFFFVPFKELLIRTNRSTYYRTDNWRYVSKTNDKIYDKVMTIEAFIENRYNNYFPFYNKINNLYFSTIIKTDKLYLKDIYLKDNTDNERIFYSNENKFFYVLNKYSKKELESRLSEEASFYNEINDLYPNINLALYIPLRYESFEFNSINENYELIIKFVNKLNKEIKYNFFKVNNINEYKKYYYKTDHHYNSYGAEIALNDILKMYNIENNEKISHKDVYSPYYGSMAKSTMLKQVSDNLTAMDISNDLEVNINDVNFKPLEKKDKNDPFYDYYVGYFNGMYDEIIYKNNTSYNRNLLIIGDSYSWQVDYLLAKHFDNTYVVNTKYGKWVDNNLVLKDYIKENNITHILFFREAKNLVFDADNLKVDKKVIR